ncbi:Protein of unknown function [Bacillus cereus]|nr:Protein of unknown function [Bacillus cereus]SCC19154.1 Protein of unknown function [Bacillus wiedmannii]SCC19877.1 Protein of unknown function [Bacillus thuringiensis]SCC29678.1 Protein of unknown function [Bacillus wiedmannii]SCL92280.1 Protein of unknown function [Bacillus wiedmannii]
MVYVISL